MHSANKSYLTSLFIAGVTAAKPNQCLPQYLKNIDASQGLCVIGFGKASVEMAHVVVQQYGEQCYGAIVTRHGYTKHNKIGRIDVLTASHPIPDDSSVMAAQHLMDIINKTPATVPVIFLISGGGSSLLSLPITGLSFSKKVEVNKFLLGCGASIDEINVVRKHLSRVKGGQLGQAVSGRYHTLIISDVVGDAPSLIASGPTVFDRSTSAQAIAILHKYQWPDTDNIIQLLKDNTRPSISDNGHIATIITNGEKALNQAMEMASVDRYLTRVMSYTQQGHACDVAKHDAALIKQILKKGREIILFASGELTVALGKNAGCGGPNQEYLLALAIELNGLAGVCAISCDTDGIDGNVDIAGAFIDSTTLARAKAFGLNAGEYLINNDSYHFFNRLNDTIITGPTHTNVNDFRAIMVSPLNS